MTIVQTMRTALVATAAATALLAAPAVAHATKPTSPGCKVVSVVKAEQYQLLGTTGWHRSVTTTTSKCRSQLVTSVTYGPWVL